MVKAIISSGLFLIHRLPSKCSAKGLFCYLSLSITLGWTYSTHGALLPIKEALLFFSSIQELQISDEFEIKKIIKHLVDIMGMYMCVFLKSSQLYEIVVYNLVLKNFKDRK